MKVILINLSTVLAENVNVINHISIPELSSRKNALSMCSIDWSIKICENKNNSFLIVCYKSEREVIHIQFNLPGFYISVSLLFFWKLVFCPESTGVGFLTFE